MNEFELLNASQSTIMWTQLMSTTGCDLLDRVQTSLIVDKHCI